MVETCIDDVSSEFAGATLGDARLSRRLSTIVRAAAMRPGESFPDMFEDDSSIDGFYRFMSNERVTAGTLAAPHAQRTIERIAASDGDVLIVQDTSDVLMEGEAPRRGMGPLGGSKKDGFRFHAALAIEASRLRPIGVPVYMTWARERGVLKQPDGRSRNGKETVTDTQSEARRWLLTAQASADAVGREQSRRLVHLMDSEADAFWLMEALAGERHRFVIRLARDRKIVDADWTTVTTKLRHAAVQTSYEVAIAKRQGKQAPRSNARSGARNARVARVVVSAEAVTLRAPRYNRGASTLTLNVVQVREQEVPAGEPAIDWVLYTTEPIDSVDEMLRVVALYRARWQIEEFFKALKTGCQLEKRQLESYHALTNALALLIPIAWRMLLLRNVARAEPDAPATAVITDDHRQVLEHVFKRPLPLTASAKDVLLVIAALGGHMKHNGFPGWLVLGRGMEKLEHATDTWVAARAHFEDVRNR